MINRYTRLKKVAGFTADALRRARLEEAKYFSDIHRLLESGFDPYAVPRQERLSLINSRSVWEVVDEAGEVNSKLTGCEVATRIIRANRPYLTRSLNVDLASYAFDSSPIIPIIS